MKSDTRIQFAKLAKFPCDTPRPYILYLEAVMMIFLQTFASARVNEFAPLEFYRWTKACLYEGIQELVKSTGLNIAWPFMQRGFRSSKVTRQCSNCDIMHKDVTGWADKVMWNLNSSQFLVALLCGTCYGFRRRYKVLPDLVKVQEHRRCKSFKKEKEATQNWKFDRYDRRPVGGNDGSEANYYFNVKVWLPDLGNITYEEKAKCVLLCSVYPSCRIVKMQVFLHRTRA